MSGASNQSNNLTSGIAVGILAFCAFGFVTYGLLIVSNLKSPTDRILAGDFSEEVTEIRSKVSTASRESQSEAYDEAKVIAAMKNFKAAPAAASAIDAPVLVEEEPAEETEAKVEPEPKAKEVLKKAKPKAATKPKAKVKPKPETATEPKADTQTEPAAEKRQKPRARKAKGKGKAEGNNN